MQIPCDPKRVKEMSAMIDPCQWMAVCSYIRDPKSEIQMALLLADEVSLEEFAAFCSGENPDAVLYQQMIEQDLVRIGSDGPLAGIRPHTFHIDSIDPNDVFNVVFLPPFYIVKRAK